MNERLLAILREKRQALISSGEAYDQGRHWEAKRIAAEVWMLVHDGRGRTKSLLGQLGIRTRVSYFGTGAARAIRDGASHFPPTRLLGMRGDEAGMRVVPFCQLEGWTPTFDPSWDTMVSFHDWWETPVFFQDSGYDMSRKNLVCSARDQDGGAHVDAELTEAGYVALQVDLDARARIGGLPIKDAHLPCLRQIGFELTYSLDQHFGPLVDP